MKATLTRGGLTAIMLCFAPLLALAQQSAVQDSAKTREFAGGPNSVPVQIEDDFADKWSGLTAAFMNPYYDFQNRMRDEKGFAFSTDYSSILQSANRDLGDASSGMIRFYGYWEAIGAGTPSAGRVIYKIEHRHRYGDVAPGGFGLEMGYVGLVGTAFTDVKTLLANLYWNQKFNGRGTIYAGWVDATDYLDVWAGASPWTGFMNFAFSTGSATIPAPNQGLGLAGGVPLTDNLFVIAGLTDSNSDPSNPGDGFDSFFDQHEYFYHAEVGWTSSQDRIYLDNVHVTYWYAAERVEALTPSGWGLNFSASWMTGSFIPFLRGGYAKDGGSFLQKSISGGFLFNAANGGHMAGVAVNWGEVNETTFAPGLPNQTTLEVFYRMQVTQRFAITPDAQLLIKPALNQDVESIFVFGLRARLAL